MICKLCKAGQQFVSADSTASGYELLNVVCFRDDRLKERTIEIQDLFASIKVIGPKWDANDVLMEIPNRK